MNHSSRLTTVAASTVSALLAAFVLLAPAAGAHPTASTATVPATTAAAVAPDNTVWQ